MTSREPAISVLMPVFNAVQYVGLAIDSIVRQTLSEFELFILDDGSTDGSAEVVRRCGQSDPRIRVIQRPNRGCVASRNELLQAAQTEYIAWLDADDLAMPERLARQIQFLDAHPDVVGLGGMVNYIDAEGDLLGHQSTILTEHEDIDASHMRGCCAMANPTTMIRRNAVIKVGGFRELHPAEDYDLWLRLAEIGRLANLDEVFSSYRMLEDSASHQCAERTWKMTWRAWLGACQRRNTEAQFQLPAPWIPRSEREAHRSFLMGCGLKAVESGRMETARRYAARALAAKPWSLGSWRLAVRSMRAGGAIDPKYGQ